MSFIIEQTRKSFHAVAAMQRHSRDVRDHERHIVRLERLRGGGKLGAAAVATTLFDARGRLARSQRALKAAETRYANAQRALHGADMALATMAAL